jgi:O-antigen ligase
MNRSLGQLADILGVRERTALSITLLGMEALAVLVSLAVWAGYGIPLVEVVGAAVVLVLAFRWPRAPLFVFAALIPVETIFVAGDLGTISRIAGITFVVTYGLPRLRDLRFRAMPLAAWLFVAWALASAIWALNIDVALVELPTLIQLFVIALLIADLVSRQPGIVRPLLWTYSIVAALTAVLGVVAYLGGNAVTSGRLAPFAGQDPAQFAAILLPALVLSVHELVNGRLLALSAPVAAAATAGILLSGTRGAWLGAGLVAAVLIVPRLSPRRRIAAVLLMVGLVVIAYQIPGVSNLVAQRAADAVPTGGAGRTDIWTVAVTIVEAYPIAGVGFANFPVAYTPERVRDAAIVNYTDPSFAPHSIIFGTVGELGLVGLFLLGMFLIPLVVRRGWGPDGAVVQAALASLMVAALFLDVLNRKQVWLIIGIAAGLAWLAAQNRIAARHPSVVVVSGQTTRAQPSGSPGDVPVLGPVAR